MPRIRIGHTPEVEREPDAEDDSAGHMPLKKSYVETPPPSATGEHDEPADPE